MASARALEGVDSANGLGMWTCAASQRGTLLGQKGLRGVLGFAGHPDLLAPVAEGTPPKVSEERLDAESA